MTLKEYQKLCIKSEPKYLTRGEEALMGLMGLNAASGKCLELYKKPLFEGSELPQDGLLEAMGEAVKSIVWIAHAIDVDLETVLKRNAASLKLSTGSKVTENGSVETLEGKDVLEEKAV